MGDVFFRILSRLDAAPLSAHCSSVFDDELQRVRAELGEVAAAFARLQEVRDAVASLEQGRSDVRRSASLMHMVASTEELHSELGLRVKHVDKFMSTCPVMKQSAAQSAATRDVGGATDVSKPPKKKEKHSKEQKRDAPSVGTDNERANAAAATHVGRVKSSWSDASDSDSGGRALKPEKAEPNLSESAQTDRQKSAKRKHIEVFQAPAGVVDNEEMEAIQARAQAKLDKWCSLVRSELRAVTKKRSKEVLSSSDLDAVLETMGRMLTKIAKVPARTIEACASKEFMSFISTSTFLVKTHGRQRGTSAHHTENAIALLDRAIKSRPELECLARFKDNLASRESIRSTATKAASAEATVLQKLFQSAQDVSRLRASDRQGRVVNLVFTLQKELYNVLPKPDQQRQVEGDIVALAAETVGLAVSLIREEERQDQNYPVYKRLLDFLDSVGKRCDPFKEQVTRSRGKLYQYLFPESQRDSNHYHTQKQQQMEGKRIDKPDSQPQASKRARTETALRQKVKAAVAEVQSWEGDIFSLNQFDKVIQLLTSVVKHKSQTWIVHQDDDVYTCIKLLGARLREIKNYDYRAARRATLQRWRKLLHY